MEWVDARSPSWTVQVKGSAVNSRLLYLDEHAPSRRGEILGSLAVEHRAILEAGVLKNAWVPYSLFIELKSIKVYRRHLPFDEAKTLGTLACIRQFLTLLLQHQANRS